MAPLFAGDTVHAWNAVLAMADVGRDDVRLLRPRTVATGNQPCAAFPDRAREGADPAVILDLDYWAFVPKQLRAAAASRDQSRTITLVPTRTRS